MIPVRSEEQQPTVEWNFDARNFRGHRQIYILRKTTSFYVVEPMWVQRPHGSAVYSHNSKASNYTLNLLKLRTIQNDGLDPDLIERRKGLNYHTDKQVARQTLVFSCSEGRLCPPRSKLGLLIKSSRTGSANRGNTKATCGSRRATPPQPRIRLNARLLPSIWWVPCQRTKLLSTICLAPGRLSTGSTGSQAAGEL